MSNLDDLMDAAAEPSLEAMRAAFEKIEKRIRMEFAEEIIAHVGSASGSVIISNDNIRRLATSPAAPSTHSPTPEESNE